MIRPVVTAALAVAAIAAVAGLSGAFGPQAAPPVQDAAVLTVTVVRPQLGRLTETMEITGMTVPREEIQVTTELAAMRIREVLADVGDWVEKGQKLAELDSAALSYQVLTLRSDYERARDAFARVDAIRESGAVSKQVVQERRTEMLAAKARFDGAALARKRATIVAPATGIIYERKAVVGGLVTTTEPLFRIARHREIELEAQAPEAALPALRPGQTAQVTLSGQDTAPVEAEIRLIPPRVDQATRMAAVRVRLPTARTVPVGLFGRARVRLSEREGMLLPRTAIQHAPTGDFVWTVDTEDTVRKWPVEVTAHDDTQVMVQTVSFYIRVVARAGALLREGDRVRLVEGRR